MMMQSSPLTPAARTCRRIGPVALLPQHQVHKNGCGIDANHPHQRCHSGSLLSGGLQQHLHHAARQRRRAAASAGKCVPQVRWQGMWRGVACRGVAWCGVGQRIEAQASCAEAGRGQSLGWAGKGPDRCRGRLGWEQGRAGDQCRGRQRDQGKGGAKSGSGGRRRSRSRCRPYNLPLHRPSARKSGSGAFLAAHVGAPTCHGYACLPPLLLCEGPTCW